MDRNDKNKNKENQENEPTEVKMEGEQAKTDEKQPADDHLPEAVRAAQSGVEPKTEEKKEQDETVTADVADADKKEDAADLPKEEAASPEIKSDVQAEQDAPTEQAIPQVENIQPQPINSAVAPIGPQQQYGQQQAYGQPYGQAPPNQGQYQQYQSPPPPKPNYAPLIIVLSVVGVVVVIAVVIFNSFMMNVGRQFGSVFGNNYDDAIDYWVEENDLYQNADDLLDKIRESMDELEGKYPDAVRAQDYTLEDYRYSELGFDTCETIRGHLQTITDEYEISHVYATVSEEQEKYSVALEVTVAPAASQNGYDSFKQKWTDSYANELQEDLADIIEEDMEEKTGLDVTQVIFHYTDMEGEEIHIAYY